MIVGVGEGAFVVVRQERRVVDVVNVNDALGLLVEVYELTFETVTLFLERGPFVFQSL